MLRDLLFILILTGGTCLVSAQTCCSGGVPLSSNLGLPPAGRHDLQLALTYDLNVLNTLKEGLDIQDDRNRSRKTHSLLWEMGYGISRRFSIDVLIPFVRQERTISQDGLNSNFTYTQDVGDAVLLLKYRVWENDLGTANWTFGLGSKLPSGPSDKVNGQGIRINADLQPGSGATDVIFWSQYTQTGLFRPSMGLFATLTFNRRGVNRNYLPIFDPVSGTERAQSYQFGNEWQGLVGLSDRFLLGAVMFDPGLTLRFRSVLYDRINDQRLPSSGGTWWFVAPNLTFWPNERFSVNVNIELPVYANIIGTQLSPSFRINTGIFYRLPLKKETLIPTDNSLF